MVVLFRFAVLFSVAVLFCFAALFCCLVLFCCLALFWCLVLFCCLVCFGVLFCFAVLFVLERALGARLFLPRSLLNSPIAVLCYSSFARTRPGMKKEGKKQIIVETLKKLIFQLSLRLFQHVFTISFVGFLLLSCLFCCLVMICCLVLFCGFVCFGVLFRFCFVLERAFWARLFLPRDLLNSPIAVLCFSSTAGPRVGFKKECKI